MEGKWVGSECRRNGRMDGRKDVMRTSLNPFLCCRRKRTVHAMRRGFLRWRKRDSDLPFWKRKTLLSPRT
jgi:hypothetical protein